MTDYTKPDGNPFMFSDKELTTIAKPKVADEICINIQGEVMDRRAHSCAFTDKLKGDTP